MKRRPRLTMIHKLLMAMLILNVVTLKASPDYENCKWIYRCCKKIRETCVKICDPEIVCPIENPVTEEPLASFFNVISVDCKAGFRQTKNGNCRRIL